MAGIRAVAGFHVRRDPCGSWIRKRALVLGQSGVGKSTIVNMLVNNSHAAQDCQKPCAVGGGAVACTQKPQLVPVPDRGLLLCDSRGLSDPDMSDLDMVRQVRGVFENLGDGPTIVIVVARFGRWTKESRMNMAFVDDMFKESWRRQSVLVLTHFAGDPDDTDAELRSWYAGCPEVQKIVERFAHVVVTNNCVTKMFEVATRSLRERCLRELNEKIQEWNEPVYFWSSNLRELIKRIMCLLRHRREWAGDYLHTELGKCAVSGQCSICLDSVMVCDMAVTRCAHTFHDHCLGSWIAKASVRSGPCTPPPCPNCQQPVYAFYGKGRQ